MKRIFKLTYAALAGVLAMAASSCTSDFKYDGAGNDDSLSSYGNVYFPEKTYSVELDPSDPTTYTIDIMREDAAAAATVPITVQGDDASFVTASSAEFAANQTSTTVTLNFPNAEIGTTYTVTLGAEGATYLDPCTFSVTRVKWNDVGFYYDSKGSKVEGYCNYTEDLVTTFYGVQNLTYPVKVQERDDKKGYYRVVNAYGEAYAYNDTGDYDTSKDYYILIDATNPDKVYIPKACDLGFDWGYGDFYVYSLAGLYIANGKASDAEGYYGTLKNGKITFPASSLIFAMANYNDGGFYYSNTNGAFCLVLDPDQDIYVADVEDDFDYEEVFTGVYSSEMLSSTGEATLFKGTCNTTKDNCDSTFAADYGTPYAIGYPYADDYPIYFGVKDGKITLPIKDPQPIGIKALSDSVYVTINNGVSSFTDNLITLNMTFTNKDGSITYGTFDEVLSHITWTQQGTGTYTYASLWGDNAVDKNLVLSQRDDDASTYKISNWLMGSDFIFTWDKTTNKCVVSDQSIGYNHPSYGAMYVIELNQYSSQTASYPQSSYDPDTKTFTFYVTYYVSAGAFGAFSETYVLDDTGGAKALKVKSVKSSAKKSMKKVALKKNMKRTYKNLKASKTELKRITKSPVAAPRF